MAGVNHVAIAGRIESMSPVAMGSALMGQDPAGPGVRARFQPGLGSQGIAAELVAARWALTREDLDAYSAQSHRRAAAARDLAQRRIPK
jgi:acetyl-CoA acyltransferase